MKYVFRQTGRTAWLILFVVLWQQAALGQAVKVNLVSASSMVFDKSLGTDLRRLIGSVVFEHEGANLYCDSAWFYEEKNHVHAYGNIRIRVSDTLNIYGDVLNYDGDLRTADLSGKVRLVDRQTTLRTDRLIYDRNTGIALYTSGGVITGGENRLTSRKGYYHTAGKQFYFRDSVVLTNPRYTMRCDTLLYHTLSKVSWFRGPTVITSRENVIYCEDGWYNTVTDVAQFSRSASIKSRGQVLKGDSLWYDRVNGLGRAFRNVIIYDSVQDVLIYGQSGDYRKIPGNAVVTDSVVGVMIDGTDSLFMHADTLYTTFDTAGVTRTLSAFHGVRFFRTDLQGICDSLCYRSADSSLALFRLPVLWTGENQLTGDSIRIWVTNSQPDSMMIHNTAFIASEADSGKFNQLKGRDMTGFFREKNLYRIDVSGNARTVYFAREDDGSRIGVNVAAASDMVVMLENREVERIKYISRPEAILHPETKIDPRDVLLPGFNWQVKKRPLKKEDIFTR